MALKSATTTLATIQMRRGREEDFDPDQMAAGEWAVSTDSKKVWMCFTPGLVLRMATYEAFEKDMEEIRAILVEAKDIQKAIETWNYLAESYAHGGTGKREGEDTDNAKYYADQAKLSADKAESIADIGIMTTEKAGIGKPDGTTITVDPDGTMHSAGSSGGSEGDFASKAIYGDNAISLGRLEGSTVGNKSIAYGFNAVSSGYESVNFGEKNYSSGNRSVAFGYENNVSGHNAFSHGSFNNVIGNNSAVIGNHLCATDDYAFAEGCGNIALGFGSHAENCQTIAGAKYVFKIAGYDSEARTFAFDDTYTGFSDAFAALAVGDRLFIQNVNYINDANIYTVSAKESDGKSITVNENIPTSNYSVLFATIIKSGGNYGGCHSEGRKNISLNSYAHAEGYMTEARGYCSHTEGNAAKATANQSHAEGYKTQATGEQSHAEGYSTVAGGKGSHAGGYGTAAYKDSDFCHGIRSVSVSHTGASFAEGRQVFSGGNGSHAEGENNIACGIYFLKIKKYDEFSKKLTFDDTYEQFTETFSKLQSGEKIFVPGLCLNPSEPLLTIFSIESDEKSIVLENANIDPNYSSVVLKNAVPFVESGARYSTGTHAEGENTLSAGGGCHSEGINTTAFGYGAHAEGSGTEANGTAVNGTTTVLATSHAEGYFTIAHANQHAQGHYNDETKSPNSSTSGAKSGTAFVIGNGTSSTRSNAARIDYNGKLWCKQAYSSTGADYAELFEWADGNPDNEDRRGYFVTMDGKKIKKASEGDYIAGIISGNPSVIGNTDMEWYGQFMRDEFGTFIKEMYKETVKEPSIDEDGNVTEVEREVDVEFYRVNPDYDPDAPYTFRLDRPEWDAVGMLGVLPVRDDGTCEVGRFCRCADGGIATLSADRGFDTYMVIERVSENIVSVILK